MANEEHVAVLKQGVEVWNQWRQDNPDVVPNLNRLVFRDFLGITKLAQVSFILGINLKGADLSDADLTQSGFMYSDLSGANLRKAIFFQSALHDSKVNNAKLGGVKMTGAYCHNTNFSSSNWHSAQLNHVSLNNSDFSMDYLRGTSFIDVSLDGVELSGAVLSHTVFANVDLRYAQGLDKVEHNGPSTIGIDTIYRSGGNIPEVFLRGAGVPDNFITFMKSLTGQAFDFYSCFISHSSKDREFVERLYADLQSSNVRCWYAPEDLKIGEPFLLGIDQGIRLHDKLLLVLSENSVNSGWVQHEVLSAMAKEQGKAPWVLFPIRLDNAVMETDVPWANMIRQSRHVGDFTQWKDYDSYKKAFDRLLRDLKGKS